MYPAQALRLANLNVVAPLYSSNPFRAAVQVIADASFVVWCVVWWLCAGLVGDRIRSAAEPALAAGRTVDEVSAQVSSAASQAGGLPMVGDLLATPLTALSGALNQLASAGREQAAVVLQVAQWTELAMLVVPIAFGLLAWLPSRARFVRTSLQLKQFRVSAADHELLALRAMSRQPLRRLRSVHPDPVAAWKAGDQNVVATLAELELVDFGWGSLGRGNVHSGRLS